MAGLSNLALSKASVALNQAQQQVAGTASGNLLEEVSRQAEEQLHQAVNHTLFGQSGDNQTPMQANQNYPPASAFYGYGRPLPATIPPTPSYAVPSGCTGHAPAQTGQAPCQWCS
jgi:hypothetical protein